MSKSGIHIKESKKGTLRKAMHAKKGEKLSVAEMKAKMKNASPAMKKKLNFAINARKWHHAMGGQINPFNYGQELQPLSYALGGWDIGNYYNDYGFGSWLGENVGNIVQTAGGVGMIALSPFTGGATLAPGIGLTTSGIAGMTSNSVENSRNKKAEIDTQKKNDITNIATQRLNAYTGVMATGGHLPEGKATLKEAKEFLNSYPLEMAMGEKVEYEHTGNQKLARRIAADHIKDHLAMTGGDPGYYTKLKMAGISDELNKMAFGGGLTGASEMSWNYADGGPVDYTGWGINYMNMSPEQKKAITYKDTYYDPNMPRYIGGTAPTPLSVGNVFKLGRMAKPSTMEYVSEIAQTLVGATSKSKSAAQQIEFDAELARKLMEYQKKINNDPLRKIGRAARKVNDVATDIGSKLNDVTNGAGAGLQTSMGDAMMNITKKSLGIKDKAHGGKLSKDRKLINSRKDILEDLNEGEMAYGGNLYNYKHDNGPGGYMSGYAFGGPIAFDKTSLTYLKKDMKHGGSLTAAKAKEMLKDGRAHKKPLTEKQKKYFQAIAHGWKPDQKAMGGPDGVPNSLPGYHPMTDINAMDLFGRAPWTRNAPAEQMADSVRSRGWLAYPMGNTANKFRNKYFAPDTPMVKPVNNTRTPLVPAPTSFESLGSIYTTDSQGNLIFVGKDTPIRRAGGGPMVNSLDVNKNMLTEYQGGGTHEENKYGGIPVGKKARVEEGEYKFHDPEDNSDYIFSNRF